MANYHFYVTKVILTERNENCLHLKHLNKMLNKRPLILRSTFVGITMSARGSRRARALRICVAVFRTEFGRSLITRSKNRVALSHEVFHRDSADACDQVQLTRSGHASRRGADWKRILVESATVFPIERIRTPPGGFGLAFIGTPLDTDKSVPKRVMGLLGEGGAAAPRVWCRSDQLVALADHMDGVEMMGIAVARMWARSALSKVVAGQALAIKMERCDACFELIRIARDKGVLITALAVPDLVESCYAAGAHSVRLLDERPTIGEQEFDHVFDFGGSIPLRRARSILAEDGQYWTANARHVSRLQRLKGQFLLGRRYRLLQPQQPHPQDSLISHPRELVMPHRNYTVEEAGSRPGGSAQFTAVADGRSF